MDVHKPKPWRGVREFLKEIGTIVIGVLIALGAEAVVENLHERRLSAEAQEAVRDEINVDLANAARRIRWEACIARRMDEIDDLLNRAEGGQPLTPPTTVGGPTSPTVYTQRWAAATAGGRTSLLSSSQQRAYGRVYTQLMHLDDQQNQEHEAWFRLDALTSLHRLSPEMIYDQRLALAKARALDLVIQQNFHQLKVFAGLLGLKGDGKLFMAAAEAARPPSVCRPFHGPKT